MRIFLSFLGAFTLACASAQTGLVVNDAVDALLRRLSNNEHIASLPNLEEDAEVKVLFWKEPVKIEAFNGVPVGGVVLKRFGDAVLETDPHGKLGLTVEVGIDETELGYEYKTEVGSMQGPNGRFNATVGATSLQVKVDVNMDAFTCDVTLGNAKVAKLGEIKVQRGGSSVVNAIFRKLLVDMLAKTRLSLLQSVMDMANYNTALFDCYHIMPSQ